MIAALTVVGVIPAALSAPAPAEAAPPSPSAAGAVLRYLTNLPNGTRDRVVSGSFGHFGDEYSLDGAQRIRRVTGQNPGLLGCDYWSQLTIAKFDSTCNKALIRHWRGGGLATVNTHFPAPGTPGHDLKDKVVLADLWKPGTAAHHDWIGHSKSYLPQLAAGLRELRDAGVPVLFRPFHEMNGDWFWWGKQNPTAFTDLWRRTYDYLSRQGLDNLIWVYSANHGVGGYTDYYPGAKYADIVGLDAYLDDPGATRGYAELLTLGKPFAFTEIGPNNDPDRLNKGQFDYQRWITAIATKFPRTAYFLAWNKDLGPEGNLNATGLMNHPWVVNHGEIDMSTVPLATDFEATEAGWTGVNIAAGPWSVEEGAATGSHSLKADVDLSRGEAFLNRKAPRDLRGRSTLRVSARHADWGTYTAPMTAKLYVRTGPEETWHDGGATAIGTGVTYLTLPLTAVPDLGDVREVGVAFTPAPGSHERSAIYVDDLGADRILEDFELGAAGWAGGIHEGAPWSTLDWKLPGERNLFAFMNTTLGETNLSNAQARDLRGHRRLSATVRHAANAPMTAKVYVRTGSARTWHDGGATPIGAAPTTLTIDLATIADLHRVVEIGVAYTPALGSTDTEAAIYLDTVTLD
ncbi:glycosyl hydrolase [Actinoplanes sp. NPDC051346]|uniref:glycosyl hydrolase n=1 Tax=Actinoplanes sp. NPDC051346 TaxID=3155048 RepID=UPI00343D4FAB